MWLGVIHVDDVDADVSFSNQITSYKRTHLHLPTHEKEIKTGKYSEPIL